MSGHQTNVMMAKLGVHYGSPDRDNPQRAVEIISEYARLMSQYSDHELSAGADLVLRRHRFRTWPTIAECISALEDYRAETREANAPEFKRGQHPYPAWSKERIAKADELIDCFLGQRAAREGWILSLHDFCRNHERLPEEREIHDLKAAARFVVACAAGGEPMGPCRDALRAMADSMLARREKLACRVLGEPA